MLSELMMAAILACEEAASALYRAIVRPNVRIWVARGDDGRVRMLVTEGVLSKRHLDMLRAIVPTITQEQRCIDLRAN